MTKNQLAERIYRTAHITGEFLLRSGAVSSEYFDKYQFESIPDILLAIAEHMEPLIPKDTEYLAALEMGGIPLATALSIKTGIPVVFVRKQAKKYGTCKFAEGPDINGKKLLIIEDVVTSGGQIVLSTTDLRHSGAEITHALCVIDRESTGAENLKAADLELRSLFTMSDLKKHA